MENKRVALTLIVKNEEDNILQCLDSLKGFYDKAFITDTGSTDRTVELLMKRPDVVISHFEWVEDFAAARNYNLQQVPKDFDYVLWCDADDRIDDKVSDKFRDLINNLDEDVAGVNTFASYEIVEVS